MARKPTPSKSEPVQGDTRTYEVTGLAPGRVAGRSVTKGDKLTLTEDQARSELLSGHIRPADTAGAKAE